MREHFQEKFLTAKAWWFCKPTTSEEFTLAFLGFSTKALDTGVTLPL
jgi:hypothetical protein